MTIKICTFIDIAINHVMRGKVGNREGGGAEAGKWSVMVDDIVPAMRARWWRGGTTRMTSAGVVAGSPTFPHI